MGVYKKGNSWRVVIYLGEGKREDWIVKGSRAEAVAFEARKRTELEVGVAREHRTAPSFFDYCAYHYRPFAEPRLKKRTWKNRLYTLKELGNHFGALKLTEIRQTEIEHYQNDRLKSKIRPSTINDEIKVLRAVMSHARRNGVPCAEPPAEDLPVRGKRRVFAWNDAQVAALLEAVREKSPRLLALVLFLLNTGCRKGEALALEWSAVDLKRGLIRIEVSEEWQPKDGEPREIPISDPLAKVLDAMPRRGRFVFSNEKGKRYAFWPQLAFDRARTHAKLKGGPHTTRHTYATHFLRARPDLYLLARILGHSDITVTKLYAHLLPDHLERARNAVAFSPPARPEENK